MPRLTYGLNSAGEMVSIEQVERGKTDLICPGCRVLLTANKGPKQGWYFSHANHSKDVFCPLRSKNGSGFPYTRKNFHLPVNTRQMDELKHIHQHKHPTDETVAQPLMKKGLVTHNPNPYTLTQQGKITLGLLPVAAFADFHLSLITGIELTQAHRNAPDGLPIEDSKKKLLSSNLYFVEIENDKIRNLYKFGMTSRNPRDRLEEIKNELAPHLPRGRFTVRLIAWKSGRGHCEAYLLHRFRDYEHKIGHMTEYRVFSRQMYDAVIDELSLLEERTPCQPVARTRSSAENSTQRSNSVPSSCENRGQGVVETSGKILKTSPKTTTHDASNSPPSQPSRPYSSNQPDAPPRTTSEKNTCEKSQQVKTVTTPSPEKKQGILARFTTLFKSIFS